MVPIELFIASCFVTICVIAYLVATTQDRLLGRSWRLSVGTDMSYRILTKHNIETDRLIKRGMETLELLEPRYGPVMPRDFNLVSAGHAADFRSPPEEGAA